MDQLKVQTHLSGSVSGLSYFFLNSSKTSLSDTVHLLSSISSIFVIDATKESGPNYMSLQKDIILILIRFK